MDILKNFDDILGIKKINQEPKTIAESSHDDTPLIIKMLEATNKAYEQIINREE